jgi:hypothetical protein
MSAVPVSRPSGRGASPTRKSATDNDVYSISVPEYPVKFVDNIDEYLKYNPYYSIKDKSVTSNNLNPQYYFVDKHDYKIILQKMTDEQKKMKILNMKQSINLTSIDSILTAINDINNCIGTTISMRKSSVSYSKALDDLYIKLLSARNEYPVPTDIIHQAQKLKLQNEAVKSGSMPFESPMPTASSVATKQLRNLLPLSDTPSTAPPVGWGPWLLGKVGLGSGKKGGKRPTKRANCTRRAKKALAKMIKIRKNKSIKVVGSRTVTKAQRRNFVKSYRNSCVKL